MSSNFADTLISSIKQKRSYVCAGIDLMVLGKEHIPDFLFEEKLNQYGPPSGKPKKEDVVLAAGKAMEEAGKRIVRAVAPYVAMIKLQVAYYEPLGNAGQDAMRGILNYARQLDPSLVRTTDSKRNDIDRTAKQYADSQIGRTLLPLETQFEAIGAQGTTVNAYLGSDGVNPFKEYTKEGKGIFVLVDTSNKSKTEFQNLLVLDRPDLLDFAVKILGTPEFTLGELQTAVEKRVETEPSDFRKFLEFRRELFYMPLKPNYVAMAELVKKWGGGTEGDYGYSAIGAVVGATWPYEAKILRGKLGKSFILGPGYKTQGGKPEDTPNFLNPDGLGVIVSSSSAIDFAYMRDPWKNQFAPEEYAEAAGAEAKQSQEDINAAVEKAGLLAW